MLKLSFSLFILSVSLFSLVSTFDEENCGVANSVSRVFDGQRIKHRKYPWLIYLSIATKIGDSSCGAVLISEKLVLTAAHCVHYMEEITLKNGEKGEVYTQIKPEAVQVYLDMINTAKYDDSPPQAVDKIMSGIFYRENIPGYDIALLVLKNPVKISRKIAPICLPTFDGEPYEGQKLTVAGWGETSAKWFGILKKAFVLPSHAHEAEVDHIPGKKCEKIYAKRLGEGRVASIYKEARELCAISFNSMADSCEGDGGGPLAWKNPDNGRYYLVATVSRGPKCPNKERDPGLYTKIKPYMDFFKKVENGEKLDYEMIGNSKDFARKQIQDIFDNKDRQKTDQ
ncbi:clotting factor G beta subunit-like [Brevipalpus obovatus]|uniref:clotting factor G beta subunit-like n=1 Tax=Brevipalpus obovatus TaxID=246614 RepID=UPI003D9EEBA7